MIIKHYQENTMKKLLLISLSMAFAQTAVAADASLKTNEQRASYTLGTDLAKNFTKQGLNIDVKALTAGMEDVLNNRALKLTEEEMMAAINEVKKSIMEKQQAAHKLAGEKNLKEGTAYLAKNAKAEGVKVLPSGVQYKVITEGKGESPKETDVIFAHYRGTLIDGSEFDSSYNRGTPLKFQMNNVIPGWGEALKLMSPGAKWEVAIPAALAYGEKGAGDVIGANSTLLFTIELMSFEAPKDEPKALPSAPAHP